MKTILAASMVFLMIENNTHAMGLKYEIPSLRELCHTIQKRELNLENLREKISPRNMNDSIIQLLKNDKFLIDICAAPVKPTMELIAFNPKIPAMDICAEFIFYW